MAYKKNVSVLQNNDLSLSGSVVTVTGSLYGSFMSGTVSEFTTVTASNLVAGGVKYPTTDGTSGQILVTDGAGELNFQDIDVTIRVKNLEATQIDKGTPLYVTASGNSGNVAGVYIADAGNTNRMPAACVAGEDISSSAEGVAYLSGFIGGVNTSTFASGDEVYVAVGGGYTNVRPTGSAKVQPLGYVEKSGANGSGVIQGPGHFWELPNITAGHFWVGASNGVPTTVASSSFAKLADDNVFTGTNTFQDITADTITAREYHTELVSASIIYQSGSTKFGDTPGGAQQDTHQFSGSLYITGSTVTLTGGSFSGNGSGLTNLAAGQLEGTIPSSVLQNSSLYVGTTQIALNRSSSTQTLNGVSIDGNSSTATTALTASSVQMELDYTATTAKYLTFLDAYNPSAGTGQKIKTGYLLYYIPNTNTLYSNFNGPLTGNASSATYASNVSITEQTSNGSYYVPFMGGYTTTTSRALYGDSGIYYNPSSNTLTVGTLVETSTRDIKENIKTIPNQLKNIKKLNPVQYNKIDSKRKEIGLIAEEVKEVYPEFVHEKGINYPKMVSILVSAVQELTEKVEQQQKEIQKIKNIKNGKKTEKTLKEKSTAKNTIVLGS